MRSISINKKLADCGWVEVDEIRSTEALIILAESLGKIIPHPDGNHLNLVKPKSSEKAINGSFSNKYGYGEFPFHTDTAFWLQPARYIVMASLLASDTETVIISLGQLATEAKTRGEILSHQKHHRAKLELEIRPDRLDFS
jgi:hypothetical protein